MADGDGFDPSEVFPYTGEGSIPRNVRRAEVHRSVKEIPEELFRDCDQLESVLLHEGLLWIGDYAFFRCSSLRCIRCPSTVTEIGVGAFEACSNLATVDLPAGLEGIEDETFAHCTSLEEVKIPASVEWIGCHAFYECTNLASAELHEGLQLILNEAFDGCSSLESLCVPSSVEEIGIFAFDGCSSLSLIRLQEDLPKMKHDAFRGCPLESFRFVPLSDRMDAIRMDDETKSMFDSRLRELTLALPEADDYEAEEDDEAVRKEFKESLGRAHDVLTYLELKGAMPVLEMALWKAKIDGEREEEVQDEPIIDKDRVQDLDGMGRERKRPKVMKYIGQNTQLSHGDCRVKCGAGIVLPEVLKFFAYSSSWPRLDDSEEGNVD